MQIAIVDDRAEDREELSACLENYMKKHQLDYTLTEFEDGENFLKAAAQVNFQLVFMDIYMENADSYGGTRDTGKRRFSGGHCRIAEGQAFFALLPGRSNQHGLYQPG